MLMTTTSGSEDSSSTIHDKLDAADASLKKLLDGSQAMTKLATNVDKKQESSTSSLSCEIRNFADLQAAWEEHDRLGRRLSAESSSIVVTARVCGREPGRVSGPNQAASADRRPAE